MSWATAGSQAFVQWFPQAFQVSGTGYTGLDSDTVNVALFNNTTAPDNTVAVGSTGYNTGVWVTGNEVTDATNWVAGGRALASKTFGTATNVFTFDAADLSGGGNVTLSGVVGCQVYDHTITAGTGGIADQGICFNYFGGAQSVTAGTFTIVWNASGVFTVTCS